MRLQTIRTVLSLARRDVTLLALSLALGIVLAPICAERAVAQAVQTRAVSCAGFDFHPINSETPYKWQGRELYRSGPGGDGWFMCAANLPHRAVVKQVLFTVRDFSNYIDVAYCALIRTPLTLTGAVQVLAMVPHTGLAALPGIVRRADTTIAFPTVDNVNYAYSLQCQIYWHPLLVATSTGAILGASVIYTISAANG